MGEGGAHADVCSYRRFRCAAASVCDLEALAFQHHILGVHAAHIPLRVEHAAIWAFGTEAGSEGASKQQKLHRDDDDMGYD